MNLDILICLINESNLNPQNFDRICLGFDLIIRFTTPTNNSKN